MAEIRVLCPRCGKVEIAARAVRLIATSRFDDGGVAVFECPGCNIVQRSTVDDHTGRALVRAGVARTFNSRPPRPPHPEHPRPGPPLTSDDLLDLHEYLAQDGWFEELTRSVEEEGRAWGRSS